MTPLERLKTYCDAAGMKPDAPLRLALVTVTEAAQEAREASKSGARGLTPEGEAQLIQRVADAAGDATERRGAGIIRGLYAGVALKFTVAGLVIAAGGYVGGRWHAETTRAALLEGAGFMAQLVELNDPGTLRDYCLKHSTAQGGGTACELPMVWLKPPARR